MTQVVTTQFQETLSNAAKYKNDHIIMTRILGEDLIAIEAKYHRSCHKQYTANSSKTSNENRQDKDDMDTYGKAFQQLLGKNP